MQNALLVQISPLVEIPSLVQILVHNALKNALLVQSTLSVSMPEFYIQMKSINIHLFVI